MLGARLSAPIGYNLACSIEVASLAVMGPLGPASASNLVKSNVIEWKSADEICTLGADKGYDATAFVAIRALKVTPHIAQNLSGRRSAAASKPEQCRPPLHGGPMRTRSLSRSRRCRRGALRTYQTADRGLPAEARREQERALEQHEIAHHHRSPHASA